MKLIFILLLALMVPVQSYAGDLAHHKEPFSGSSNKLFSPLAKQEQLALTKANPMEDVGYDIKQIERISWVRLNIAEIDALRSFASDILETAENGAEFQVWQSKDVEGHKLNVQIKAPLEFPVDINLNFFDDIQFNDLHLSKITKTTTDQGKVFFSLNLDRKQTYLPSVFMVLEDKLTIYTEAKGGYVRLEQVGKSNYRIYQQKILVNYEGQREQPEKKSNDVFGQNEVIPKQFGNTSALMSSTPRYIDVLVLFDNHSNQTLGKSTTVRPGIDKINTVLRKSNINAEIRVIAYDNLPALICGGGSSPCYSSYSSHLDEITASKEVLALRLKYGADAAILLRSTVYGDLDYQTAGIANRTNPSDPYQADKTYALVYAESGENTFAHEIGHVLGAGHSAYNDLPGSAPAVAQLTFYDDKVNLPRHKDAVKSFMTYEYLCHSELDKVNATSLGKHLQECIKADQFSGPVQYSAPWVTTPIMLGSEYVANRYRVDDVTFRAPGWNLEIVNHKPEPAIRFVDVPLVTGYPNCFNAVGSTDPDGDRLVRFYWFITKYGDYNKIKEAEYGTKESTFCWTPTHAQRGDYHVSLSVRDENGADKIIGKTLHIVYDPDYISAPELYLHKVGSSDITLSWSTPTNGSVGYYDVVKKVGDVLYLNLATSWDTMEDISFDKLSQGDNYFRVRGCKFFGGCGAWSNMLYYNHRNISLNTQ